MTPQERQLLQQNASLTQDLGAYGAPSSQTPGISSQPSQPPQTISEGLSALKGKMNATEQSTPDFESLMKKYNVKDMLPSSLKGIMTQKSTPVAQPTRVLPVQPMFQQRGAQEAAGSISGALGDITQKMQTIRPAMTYERNPEMNQRLRQFLSSQGRKTTLPEEGSKEYFDVVREMEVSPGQGGIFGEAGIEARKSAQEGQQKFGESFGEIDLGIRKVAQGDMSGLDQIFRKGVFQGISGASGVVFSPVAGAFSQAPEPVKQALGQAVKFTSDVVDGSLSTVGIDPNSMLGQNIKAGMIALMDVAPILGSSKAVRAGVKSAGQTAKGVAQGALAKAAPYGTKVLEGTMIAGKQGAKLLNDAAGKIGSQAKKFAGKGLDVGSNAVWTTPSATMKKAFQYGDDYIRVADDIPKAQATAFQKLEKAINTADDAKKGAGSAYKGIRASSQPLKFTDDITSQKWTEFGLDFKDGKFSPTGGNILNSRLKADDIALINKEIAPLLPVGGKAMTPNQFLNFRNQLDEVAKFNMGAPGKSQQAMQFARDLRSTLNQQAKAQFPSLSKADELAKEAISEYNNLRQHFMAKDRVTGQWYVKDSIKPESIQNLLSPANRRKLQALEGSAKGITKELDLLNTAVQIEKAANIATGAGVKQLLTTGAGFGALGPVGAIAGFILSNPQTAAKMFARMGKRFPGVADTVKGAAKESVKKATSSASKASSAVKTNLSYLKQKTGKATTKGAKGAADVGGMAGGTGTPTDL